MGRGDRRRLGGLGLVRWRRSRGVFTLLFTTFLTHPPGLWDGAATRPRLLARPARRRAAAASRAQFYSSILVTIEWPVLLLGDRSARSRLLQAQARCSPRSWSGTSALSLAVYSWAGEKFAWLVLHPLLPLVLLAGVGVQGIWQARGAWRVAGLALALGRRRLPRRQLVVGERRPRHRPARVPRLHAVLRPTSRRSPTRCRAQREPRPGQAAADRHASTPPRARRSRTPGTSATSAPATSTSSRPTPRRPTSDVLILTDASKARLEGALTDYDCRQFDFRVWWVRDYGVFKATDKTSPGPMRPAPCSVTSPQRKTVDGHRRHEGMLCIKKPALTPQA